MKTLFVCTLLLVAVSALVLPQHASAQNIYASNSIYYDDSSGTVYASGYTSSDDYAGGVFLTLNTPGNGHLYSCRAWWYELNNYASLSADVADYGYGDYSVESDHFVVINNWDPDRLLSEGGSWTDNGDGTASFIGECQCYGWAPIDIDYYGEYDLGSLESGINVPPPVPSIDGISPSGGSAGTAISITLTGSNLDAVTSINVGNGITASIDFQSFDFLGATVTLSSSANGNHSLTATSPYGTSNAVTFTVEDTTPTITGIDQSVWQAGAATTVTFTGQHFGTNAPTLGFSPSAGISYTLSSYNDTQIVANVSVAPGTPNENVSVTVTSNGYYGSAFRPGASRSSPTSSPVNAMVHTPINSPRRTVIGWIDGTAITLPSGANITLTGKLTVGAFSCVRELSSWALGFSSDLNNSADIAYANAWLLQHSPNQPPPLTIDPTTQLNGGDYRLFNDFGSNSPGRLSIGITPDPCKFLSFLIPRWLEEGQASQYNGSQISPSGHVYQLAEGRVGTIGQAISLTINGRTVPWIYNVIEFDSTGTETTTISSTFPTFSVYENNTRIAVIPQSSVEEWVAKNDTYEKTPADIP